MRRGKLVQTRLMAVMMAALMTTGVMASASALAYDGDDFKQDMRNTGENIREGTEKVIDKTGDVVQDAAHGTKKGWNKTKRTTQRGWNKTKENTREARNDLRD